MHELYDDRPITRRADDRPEADEAPALTHVETVAPRAVRSQIVAIDGQILGHQDIVAALFDYMPIGGDGRRLLRSLHGNLEETHKHVQGLLRAVERGG